MQWRRGEQSGKSVVPEKYFFKMSKNPTKKLKWTDQMNKDLLMCKRKALEMVASENPPRKDDGRKRGYIKVMKQLWEESGYQDLGLKAQNLRDQASRLEKL